MVSTPSNPNCDPDWLQYVIQDNERQSFNPIMNGFWCDEYDTFRPTYDDDYDQDNLAISYELETT